MINTIQAPTQHIATLNQHIASLQASNDDHQERLRQLEEVTHLHSLGIQDCQEEQETLRSLRAEINYTSARTLAHQNFLDGQAATNQNVVNTLEELFQATKELQGLQMEDNQQAPLHHGNDVDERASHSSHPSTPHPHIATHDQYETPDHIPATQEYPELEPENGRVTLQNHAQPTLAQLFSALNHNNLSPPHADDDTADISAADTSPPMPPQPKRRGRPNKQAQTEDRHTTTNTHTPPAHTARVRRRPRSTPPAVRLFPGSDTSHPSHTS
eukprot:310091-Amphidinium_carterae.1